MKHFPHFALVLAMATLVRPVSGQSSQPCKPEQLTCDLIENAYFHSVKIGDQRPDFSWALPDSGFDIRQAGYQILVAGSLSDLNANQWNWWNSGRVNSPGSCGVQYGGKPLEPNAAYYWKVRVWYSSGEVSDYSAPQCFFTTGQLSEHFTPRYALEKTDQLPVSLKKIKRSSVADFGADGFCSQVSVTLSSGANPDTLFIKVGEALNPDGSINETPPANVCFQVYPIFVYPGRHTYVVNMEHKGGNIKLPDYIGEVEPFRYVQVESPKNSVGDVQVIRSMVNYPFDDSASEFESSDTILNQVWQLCKYSMKVTSFAGQFVDGDRERKPYEADALINQLGYYYATNDYSIARYSHEYLITHPTWPTEWILISVIMAWNDYLYTGDLSSLKYYYKDLTYKSLSELEQPNGLISTSVLQSNNDSALLQHIHLSGDHLRDIVDWPSTEGYVKTPYNTVVNSFYYIDLIYLSKIAAALGIQTDAVFYQNKAARFKRIFNQSFWDKSRGVYKDGLTTAHASLHANIFPLAFGLNDPKNVNKIMTYIRSQNMACSVYGAQFLLDAVYVAGDGQYGLKLLTSTDERSWYNMLREGSSITMEAWGNNFKKNQDWNHAWGAAPANIIPRRLLGILPLEPGWAEYQVEPELGDLKWVEGKFPTVKGTIRISCKNDSTGFQMRTTVPANALAHVILSKTGDRQKVYVNGIAVKTQTEGQKLILPVLGSGVYSITIRNPRKNFTHLNGDKKIL